MAHADPRLVAVNRTLAEALDAYEREAPFGGRSHPAAHERLVEALRWVIDAGGKRIRPLLCLAARDLYAGGAADALAAAAAVEFVHTYSLVHDDLPAMDDDDLRRGRATLHKKYNEATAILAGDALLTEAFALLTRAYPAETAGRLAGELAFAAGARGMVAGQIADMEAEGRTIDIDDLLAVHRRKTGALITAAIRMGAIVGRAPDDELAALTAMGESVGLLFQVVDDILDVTQPTEVLGKTAGKDQKAAKATFPSLLGIEKTRAYADGLANQSMTALGRFGRRGDELAAIVRAVHDRVS